MSYAPRLSESPPVFGSSDCITHINQLASENCPHLEHLWSSMGINQSNVHLLMFELYDHINDVFVRTIKEAEDELIRLKESISNLTVLIPQLAKEIDDVTAINELNSINQSTNSMGNQSVNQFGEMGLRQKSEAIQLIYDRLIDRKNQAAQYITESIKELNQLYRELGSDASLSLAITSLIDLSISDYSLTRCEKIRTELTRVQSIKHNKIQSINQIAQSIIDMCKEIDVIPDEFTSSLTSSQFSLDDPSIKQSINQSNSSLMPITYNSLIHSLNSRFDRLQQLKSTNQAQSNKLLDSIHKLWTILGTDPYHQQSFLNSINQSFSNSTIKRMERELQDLEERKVAEMEKIILEKRNEINAYWEKLGYSDQQKSQFRPFYQPINQSIDNDRLLEEHECERDRLHVQYSEYSPILKLVSKRDEYRHLIGEHEVNQCENASSDRLMTRKSNYTVLREQERIHNIVSKWLPQCEEKLIHSLNVWERAHGMDFMWNGDRLIDVILMDIEEAKQHALAKKRAAEEARGKNAERNSVYGQKATGSRSINQSMQSVTPLSASKRTVPIKPTINQSIKPRSLNTTLNHSPSSSLLNTSLCSNASSSSQIFSRKSPSGPLFDSRIPNLPTHSHTHLYGHQSINQSPVRPISRTTPCKMTPSRLPMRQANKENSSL